MMLYIYILMSSQPVQLFSVSEYYIGTRREYTYRYTLCPDITIHFIVYGETAKFVDMGYWETSSNRVGNIFEVQKKCKKIIDDSYGNIIKINQNIWIQFRGDNTINLFDTNRLICDGEMNYVDTIEEESINMDDCDAIKID